MSYDVDGPEPVARRSITKPIRTAIVLGVLAVAVLAAFQWGWQQLTQPFDDEAATAGATGTPSCTPAPEAIAALPAPGRITVNVYNASGVPELATRTAEQLQAQGFRINDVDNDPLGKELSGVGELRSAPNVGKRIEQLRRYLPGATWIKDDRPGRRIDFAVGSDFTGVVTPEPPAEAEENTEDDIPTC